MSKRHSTIRYTEALQSRAATLHTSKKHASTPPAPPVFTTRCTTGDQRSALSSEQEQAECACTVNSSPFTSTTFHNFSACNGGKHDQDTERDEPRKEPGNSRIRNKSNYRIYSGVKGVHCIQLPHDRVQWECSSTLLLPLAPSLKLPLPFWLTE